MTCVECCLLHQLWLLQFETVIQEGYRIRALQRNPHIVLLNPDWYHEVMKPIIADWTYLWLEAQHMANITEREIKQYILEGANHLKNPEVARPTPTFLCDQLQLHAAGDS